jgi:hypothetical protein
MNNLTRRQLLQTTAAAALAVGLPEAAEARQGFGFFGGAAGPSPPLGYSATMTLVNDDPTNVTVAGVPTRTFGWPFPKGAIPHGYRPAFAVSGVAQPFSMSPTNACRYWPDGSLMFASFMLRPTFGGIAANGGTQAVAITSVAGSYPTATRNYTTELYPNNFGVVAPVSTYDAYEAGRTFASWLNVANAANIRQVRTHLVGDAGDVYSFSVDMIESAVPPVATLAPHGLLTTQIYVHLMTYAPGGTGTPALAGYRFWADVRQPYIDGPVSGFGGAHLSPVGNAAKDYRLFVPPNTTPANGFNYTVGGTAHNPPNWPFSLGGYPVTAALTGAAFVADVAPITWTGTVTSTYDNGAYTAVYISTSPVGLYGGMVVQGGPLDGAICRAPGSPLYLEGGGWGSYSGPITFTGGLVTVSSGTAPTKGQLVTDTTGNLPVPTKVYGPGEWGPSTDPPIVQTTARPWTATISSEAMLGGYASVVWSAEPPITDGNSSPKSCAVYLEANTFGGLTDTNGNSYVAEGGPIWLQQGGAIFAGADSGTRLIPASPTGSGTMVAAPVSQPGMRLALGGAGGEWVFFQGNGALSTDVPLRSGAVDQVAWGTCQVIPPFAIPGDPVYPPIVSGPTGANGEVFPYNGWNPNGGTGGYPGPGLYQYWPYCMGANDANDWLVSGGIGHYLSGTPFWAGSDFYCGDRTSYFYGLMAALGVGCWLGDFVLSASPSVLPNTGNNLTPSGGTRAYLGMTTTIPLFNGENSWSWPGYTAPAARVRGIKPNNDMAHAAEFGSWAYLRTGRPELLDRLLAEALYAVSHYGSLQNYTDIPGKNYYNALTPVQMSQVRADGNKLRWMAWAALLYPHDESGLNNTNYSASGTFDGTHCDQYLLDLMEDNFQLIVDCVDPQYSTTYVPIPANPGATFTATISGNTLDVNGAGLTGTLAVGHCIKDVAGHIPPNWFITALGTGSGGAGTYTIHEIVTGNVPNAATLSVASEAMFCGAGALLCNDKDLFAEYGGNYYWWPNTFCESVGLWTAAPVAATAGSAAAAECIRNWATCSQAFADRRGGRINEWPYFFGSTAGGNNGNFATLDGLDTELTCIFRALGYPSGFGGFSSCQSFAVTPGPSSRAFEVFNWSSPTGSPMPIANGDALVLPAPPAPSQPASPYFIVADLQDAGGGSFNLNLKNPDGSYVAPGAATGIWTGNWLYRSNGYDGTNGTDGHNLTAQPWGTLNYNVLKRVMFAWAHAMIAAGLMTDTGGGYIANANADLNARFAGSGAINWIGGTWGGTYWAGVNIMDHF